MSVWLEKHQSHLPGHYRKPRQLPPEQDRLWHHHGRGDFRARGGTHLDLPVFDTVHEAVATGANASGLRAALRRRSILEAIDAAVPLVVHH